MYCMRNGKPEILVQDLNDGKVNKVTVNDDVGEILPSVNEDYEATSLSFHFSSPFVYQ